MTPYAFVVGADYKYLPELCALLNSLDYVGNSQDVHVFGINLPIDFVDQFKKLDYEVFFHNVSEEEIQEARGISEITCRKRYYYAGLLGEFGGFDSYMDPYKSVCILDADLIFCRNPIQFFTIAEKTGFILGPTKEQNKCYDDPHHEVNGKWIIEKGFWNDKDLCNCPVFLDPRVWGEALKRSWDIFFSMGYKAPDMDAMNMCFIEAGGHDKIIKLPGLQWLGTNEQHLKPYTRVTLQRDGNLWTENGLEIFCFHGQYYHDKWRECQLGNRHGCARGYLGATEKPDSMAAGAMKLLYDRFTQMLDHKIQIEKIDYRH